MFRFKSTLLLAAAATVFSSTAYAQSAPAGCGCGPCDCAPHQKHYCCCCYANCCCDGPYMRPIERAQWYNWNRNYANTEYGQPVALVVPPTANMQTNYGWGVASSRISRIDHQFQRNYPGEGTFGGPFRRTPVWPSDTTQFGVYYGRGPW
jgi:hypothetical protein